MRKVLYLGLTLPKECSQEGVVHYPIIRIEPRPATNPDIRAAFKAFEHYTHLVITSKSSLPLLYQYAQELGITADHINSKQAIAVGKKTAEAATNYGMQPNYPANETAEGIVELLQTLNLAQSHFFWPHSAHSRPILTNYFQSQGIKYTHALFYDTLPNLDLPSIDPESFDEIVFTSPSTISAFQQLLGPLPWHKTLTPIGPVTAAHLNAIRN